MRRSRPHPRDRALGRGATQLRTPIASVAPFLRCDPVSSEISEALNIASSTSVRLSSSAGGSLTWRNGRKTAARCSMTAARMSSTAAAATARKWCRCTKRRRPATSTTRCRSSPRARSPTCATVSSLCSAASSTRCGSRTSPPTSSTASARRSSAMSWATTIPTATPRSTRPWCGWRSRSRFATRSSTARATSDRSTATAPRRCVTPNAGWHASATSC